MAKRSTAFKRFIYAQEFHAVYVIGVKDFPRVAKVGIADDPLKRFANIQQDNWAELFIHGYRWCAGRPLSHRIEQAVLERHKDKAIRGEWLELQPSIVLQTVIECAEEMRIPVALDEQIEPAAQRWFEGLVRYA